MTGFPLSRLPLLPLKDALNMMNPGDLTSFYLCSKKTRDLLKALKKYVFTDYLSSDQKLKLGALKIIKTVTLKNQNSSDGSILCFPTAPVSITVEVGAADGIEIQINRDHGSGNSYFHIIPPVFKVEKAKRRSQYTEERENFHIGKISVPCVIKDNSVCTFSVQFFVLKNLIDYFKNFFNTNSIKCRIYGSNDLKFSRNLRTVLKGIDEQTISSCEICNDIINDEDYKLILDNFTPTNSFKHVSNIASRSDDFRHKTNFKSKHLKLEPANWFTYDNLITTECEYIQILQTRFTNRDICEYLKLWMEGKVSKLKCLTVELGETADLQYIFSEFKSSWEKRLGIYEVTQKAGLIYIAKDHVTVAKIAKILSGNMIEFLVI